MVRGYVKINFHSLVENLSSFDLSARARVPKLRNNNRSENVATSKSPRAQFTDRYAVLSLSVSPSFHLSIGHYNYRPPGNFSLELDGHN